MDLYSSKGMGNTFSTVAHFFIILLLVGAVFVVLSSLVSSYSLGHDESVYLAKARSWMVGTPADQFEVYRPIGMPIFGWLFLQFGESEISLRFFGIVFGIVTILFAYLLFRLILDEWVALATVSIVSTSTLFLREAPHFLNDIPSAGVLLALMYFFCVYVRSGATSRVVYLIPILASLAFYLRYGTATTLVVIGLLSFILFFPSLKTHVIPFARWKGVLLLFLVLFIPHIIESFIYTGDIIGILAAGGRAAGREYLGEGLITYAKWLPNEMGGWVIGSASLVGIIATFVIIARRKLHKRFPGLVWVGSIGLASLIVTGLLVHAEPRYAFFSLVLLSGAGVAGIYYLVSNWSINAARFLIVAVVVTSFVFGVQHYHSVQAFFEERETNKIRVAYLEAANAARKDGSSEKKCALWTVDFKPAMSWYSRCETPSISNTRELERGSREDEEKKYYTIVATKTQSSQLDPAWADTFGVTLVELFRAEKTPRGDIILYRIEKK